MHRKSTSEKGSGIRPRVIQGADVGVIQGGDGTGFGSEAGTEIASCDPDGNIAIVTRVAGLVQLTHPACADGAEDFIAAWFLANVDWHIHDAVILLDWREIGCLRGPRKLSVF